MRTCENCYNGHFTLKNNKEEMYCDINKLYEKNVSKDYCCQNHRYFKGCEEEKNYVVYDDTYLGPGYFIYNEDKNNIVKFFKIFIMNNYGFPNYGIRVFSINGQDNPLKEFNNIEFTFRDKEDSKSGLYQMFTNLCNNLSGNYITTVDRFNQGKNHLSLIAYEYVTKIIFSKDVYGVRKTTEFIDIDLGDEITCEHYEEINAFYKCLSTIYPPLTQEEDIQKLLLMQTNTKTYL